MTPEDTSFHQPVDLAEHRARRTGAAQTMRSQQGINRIGHGACRLGKGALVGTGRRRRHVKNMFNAT